MLYLKYLISKLNLWFVLNHKVCITFAVITIYCTSIEEYQLMEQVVHDKNIKAHIQMEHIMGDRLTTMSGKITHITDYMNEAEENAGKLNIEVIQKENKK